MHGRQLLTPAGPGRWTVRGTFTLAGVSRPVDLAYLGTGPDPWGGLRAAFRAETELRREDFATTYNQVVRAESFVRGFRPVAVSSEGRDVIKRRRGLR
ncbi:YceI family protein [Nonomuraea wenchangensis]